MAMKLKRILLTGGSGHVGRRFLSELALRQDVFVDRLGRTESDDIHWNELDADTMKDIEVVYHLAGSTDQWSLRNNDEAHHEANVVLSERLFEAFLESDAKLFVYMSTAKVMGEGCVEGYSVVEMPMPISPYAKSKWEAEKRLNALWHDYKEIHPDTDKRWVVLRPTMIYGVEMENSLTVMWNWIGKGKPVLSSWRNVNRSMVSLESVMEVLLSLPSASGLLPCYFLADLPVLTLGEVMQCMADHQGVRLRYCHLSPWMRRLMLLMDEWFLFGKIAWQLGRLENDFVVRGAGIWGIQGTKEIRMSAKRLDDTLLQFRLRKNW